MNRIHLLPDQVANQIAAGEVVERPRNAVKELVENAIDAGADDIRIEIQAGGRSLIRVEDNGSGMSRDDALLCLERHATSKVKTAEDLFRVSTMGFRGEALASIASVGRMVLRTREKDSETPEGVEITVHGGKIIEVGSAPGATGTSVEVRQLFYNLPARKKFLKSEETERAHIQHYLTLAALAHPGIRFSFRNNQRSIWQLPVCQVDPLKTDSMIRALRDRYRSVYSSDPILLEVAGYTSGSGDFSLVSELDYLNHPPDGRLRIWGLISRPDESRSNRTDLHFFVNRRPVESNPIHRAIREAYHTALIKGRYPLGCLFLDLDPSQIDINIHPAKREVKFQREGLICGFVTRSLQAALQWPGSGTVDPPGLKSEMASEAATLSPTPKPRPFSSRESETSVQGEFISPDRVPDQSHLSKKPVFNRASTDADSRDKSEQPTTESAKHQPEERNDNEIGSSDKQKSESSPEPTSTKQTGAGVGLSDVPLRFIGVIKKIYIIMESDRGLVLMDAQAAHERVLFEEMLSRLESEEIASQKLLLPETVEVNHHDAIILKENMETLSRLGVGLSEFGNRTFLLDALPPFVKINQVRNFILQLVDQLQAAGKEINSMRLGEQVVARTVSRQAVLAEHPLPLEEMETLIGRLQKCRMPYTSPYGRPTLIEMSQRELERKFGR